MSGFALAAAAQSLIGCRFRLHGRDPDTGLDCLGVLVSALRKIGRDPAIPVDYALRVRGYPRELARARDYGFEVAEGAPQAGDVLLYRVGPCQLHFAIWVAADQLVHAHAGLGKVVLTGVFPDWQPCGHWRLLTEGTV